jgi:hypothetical protein
MGPRRFWPVELVALGIAGLLDVGVLLAATTLVDEDGASVLLVAAVPLLITIGLAVVLARRGTDRAPGVLGWTVAGLLLVFTMAGAFTIGLLAVPATLAVAVACAVRQGRSRPVAVRARGAKWL